MGTLVLLFVHSPFRYWAVVVVPGVQELLIVVSILVVRVVPVVLDKSELGGTSGTGRSSGTRTSEGSVCNGSTGHTCGTGQASS